MLYFIFRYSYWESLISILTSLSRIMGIFEELKYSYSNNINDNGATLSVKDENVSAIDEYHIKDINSIDEIVDAIYYLLLDINGVDIFNRTSYWYMRYEISRYNQG